MSLLLKVLDIRLEKKEWCLMIFQRKKGKIKKIISRCSHSKNNRRNLMGRVMLRMKIKEENIGIFERSI